MAEFIELAEAVEAVAREIYVQTVTKYDGASRELAENRWNGGHISDRNKFFYRATAMDLVKPAFEPIARQVWAAAQEQATTESGSPVLGDYPGFEVTRG